MQSPIYYNRCKFFFNKKTEMFLLSNMCGYWIHLKYPTESDTADVIQVVGFLSHSKGKVGPISCTVLQLDHGKLVCFGNDWHSLFLGLDNNFAEDTLGTLDCIQFEVYYLVDTDCDYLNSHCLDESIGFEVGSFDTLDNTVGSIEDQRMELFEGVEYWRKS